MFKKIANKKLINALQIAINALEKDFVYYNWTEQESCNCGVVIQAVLNKTEKEVKKLFDKAYDQTLYTLTDCTWRSVAKFSCTITGIPLTQVFKLLGEYGMQPEDIVHLEYLNNPGILEISEIDTTKSEYYSEQENLIKYLKAWLIILEGKTSEYKLSIRGELEAKLLLAVNQENFESAWELRDKISSLK